MKKIFIVNVGLILTWVAIAWGGNFDSVQKILVKENFTYKGEVQGFHTYMKQNPEILIMIRNCKDFLCEAILTTDPVSDAVLANNLILIYGGLQNTLQDVPGINIMPDPGSWNRQVYALIQKILTNLEHANRTEFAFDHLIVRGQCDPIPEKELKAGHKPMLLINLWIL